jgi:hypothetical protein
MAHYSFSVYALLIFSTALQFFACWTALKKGYFTHWKAFSYYLFLMTAGSVVGTYAAFFGSATTYRIVYAGSATLEAITLSLVVFEIMVKMLEPFEALPGRLVARFGFWAAIGISLAITLSVSIGTYSATGIVGSALTVERTVFLADATLLWLLLFQARSLGVSWQSSAAEISVAFVLYLTVQAAVRFIVNIYATNDRVVDIANGFGQFAYMISLCSWIWTMRHRDPASVLTSPEKLAEVQALASQHDAVPKERIFAAVGIRINKIETGNESGQSEQPSKVLLN